jgi:hypothetical protein
MDNVLEGFCLRNSFSHDSNKLLKKANYFRNIFLPHWHCPADFSEPIK